MGFLRKMLGGQRLPDEKSAPEEDVRVLSQPSDLGFVRGKHFTEWSEHVKQLKRDKRQQEVIDLCTEIIAAAEDENRVNQWGVPPGWYEQLALAARRSEQPIVEREAMNRYLAQPGSKHPEYLEKFEKNLAKLDAKEGKL